MKILQRLIPSLCLLFLFAPEIAQASDIQCDKPDDDIEKMICISPELTKLEEDMDALYRQIEAETAGVDGETGKPINRVKDEQMIWINTIRNQCKSASCLEDAYRKRTERMRETWKDALQ